VTVVEDRILWLEKAVLAINTVRKKFFPGRSVRPTSQANGKEMITLRTVTISDILKVLIKAVQFTRLL